MCCVARFVARRFILNSSLFMRCVARFVALRFFLNSVQMTYAVVRFVARHLTFIYNYCKSLMAHPVVRRVVYFLIQFK
jgi:hypothetical protein